jgi:hypothetical protein
VWLLHFLFEDSNISGVGAASHAQQKQETHLHINHLVHCQLQLIRMADDLQSIIGCTHRQAVALLDAYGGNGNLAAKVIFRKKKEKRCDYCDENCAVRS